jgi:hypothetical protein
MEDRGTETKEEKRMETTTYKLTGNENGGIVSTWKGSFWAWAGDYDSDGLTFASLPDAVYDAIESAIDDGDHDIEIEV